MVAFLFRGPGREGVALFAVVEAENTRVTHGLSLHLCVACTSRLFSSEARLSVASAALPPLALSLPAISYAFLIHSLYMPITILGHTFYIPSTCPLHS